MRRAAVIPLAVAWLAVSPAAAPAAFPGTNGKIAFDDFPSATGEIFTIDPDGQNLTNLTNNDIEDSSAVFSTDGERIVWSRENPGPGQNIWAMGADGANPVQLTSGDGLNRGPAFFPDGRIAWASVPNPPGHFQIYVMNADGSNPTPLTNPIPGGTQHPAVSPDTQRIAFDQSDGSDLEIFVMGADGSDPRPLTTNPGQDIWPDWSPDGQRIVYISRVGGDDEVFVMDANGDNPTPLTDTPVDERFPVFSPDGQKIAFFRPGGGGGVFVVDANGDNATPLTGSIDSSVPDWQPLNPPACDLSGPKKQKSFGEVTLTATCTNEDAAVTAEGTGKAKVPKLSIATASKQKKFSLEPVTVEVPPNQPTTLHLGVPKKGKRALKKAAKAGKKGKATVTATATDDLGAQDQDSLGVKFKKKK